MEKNHGRNVWKKRNQKIKKVRKKEKKGGRRNRRRMKKEGGGGGEGEKEGHGNVHVRVWYASFVAIVPRSSLCLSRSNTRLASFYIAITTISHA